MENIHYYYVHHCSELACHKGADRVVDSVFGGPHENYFWITCKYTKACRKKGIIFSTWRNVEVEDRWAIPVFLYGDGETFYEFFTKQMIGKRKNVDSVVEKTGWLYVDKRPDVPPAKVEGFKVIECDAADFLKMVKEAIRGSASVGLTEQDIRMQIKNRFSQEKKNYEDRIETRNHAQQAIREMLK